MFAGAVVGGVWTSPEAKLHSARTSLAKQTSLRKQLHPKVKFSFGKRRISKGNRKLSAATMCFCCQIHLAIHESPMREGRWGLLRRGRLPDDPKLVCGECYSDGTFLPALSTVSMVPVPAGGGTFPLGKKVPKEAASRGNARSRARRRSP